MGLLRTVFAYGFGYALAERSCLPAGPVGPGKHDDLQRFRRVSALIPHDVPGPLMREALKVCGDCHMTARFIIGIDLMIRGLDAYLAETAG